MPPSGSTIFTPLSGSGLCDAVIIRPHACPSSPARTAVSRPHRNTVDASTVPLFLKPAVPYVGLKSFGSAYCELARDIRATSKLILPSYAETPFRPLLLRRTRDRRAQTTADDMLHEEAGVRSHNTKHQKSTRCFKGYRLLCASLEPRGGDEANHRYQTEQ